MLLPKGLKLSVLWPVSSTHMKKRCNDKLTASSSHASLMSAPKYPERSVCLSSVLQGNGEETHRGCRQGGMLHWERLLGHWATEVQMVSDIYCLWLVSTLSLDGPPLTQDLESRISWLSYLFFPRTKPMFKCFILKHTWRTDWWCVR